MANSYISDRIVFLQSKDQGKFLAEVLIRYGGSWSELAHHLGINARTLRDWSQNHFKMSFTAAKKLSRLAGVSLPNGVSRISWQRHMESIAKKGGEAIVRRYGKIGGDAEYRMVQWRKWWQRKGRWTQLPREFRPKHVRLPEKSPELAEFVGIVLGDGGMTNFQLKITLNIHDEIEYAEFIISLIKKIFHITPSLYNRVQAGTLTICVSRVELIKFCTDIGLKRGNKVRHQVDIPSWIHKHPTYSVACLRGLIDTDGGIILHTYRSNGKVYHYKKIGFTSRSLPLLRSTSRILKGLNITHRMMGKCDIRIESLESVARYFQIVGTHNNKHLKRYLD